MKKLYITFYSLLITFCCAAQDLHFSQFYEAPVYRNPALAGIMKGDIRAPCTYRSQWNNVANAYKTGAFSIEYKTHPGQGDDFMTLGVQTYFDKAGTTNLSTNMIMPVINYHKSVSETRNAYFSAAFMGGLVQRRFDRSKMTTNNQYDYGTSGEELTNTQYSYWDGSAGLSYNTGLGENEANNLVIGVAYHHLNRPKNSFFNASTVSLSPKISANADLVMDVREQGTVTVYSELSKQGTYTEFVAGVLYGLKIGALPESPDYVLHAGAFIRWNDAVIPTIRLDYDPFSVGISYDVNVSKLTPASHGVGGFELSVTYRGFLDKFNSSFEALKCPRF